MSNVPSTTTTDWQAAPKPTNSRLVAIGDVHGCSHLLRALRAQLASLPAHRLVYLGDLIDPHPHRIDSAGPGMSHSCADMMDQIADDIATGNCNVLAGNHDAFFHIAREAVRNASNLPWREPNLWSSQGGLATAAAWGISFSKYETPNDRDLAREIDARLTQAQRGVFDAMKLWVDHDAYLLVHAGFHPQMPLAKQQARTSITTWPTPLEEQIHPLWMRFNPTTDAAPKDRVLVHGHISMRSAILGRKRIDIDTGAKHGGPLTALEIDGDRMRLHQAWPPGMDAVTWKKDGLR